MKKLIKIIVPLALIGVGIVFMGFNQKSDYTENKIEAKKLEEMKAENETVFVVVGNRSCSSCQEYKPIMEEAIGKTNATVYYMDTDNSKNSGFLKENNVTVTPTILMIKDGELKRLEGSRKLEETEEILLGRADF
ncbi:thioredoxin family protein [Candidatus Enterococcus clewellii]|uniref:Uncharacterized protein n=1 Tax=Candidatus Enterococcus clewellii TaxID=1834193 RepID=A0A242K9W5_9ENTE|nr:thioredoxin family protein [Enterococcus sp. 9E7_DIV0242]OTP17340.1 hypothetical protein A5888_001478 [Enterococcus sp. 9E7_DIV0242]